VSERGPILKNIVNSYVLFRNAFGTIRNNYLFCPLLNNSCFSFKIGGEKTFLDDEFFNNNMPNLVANRKTICYNDFTDAAGNVKSINQLRAQIDRDISADCVRIIRSCMTNIKKLFSADSVAACTIHDFMGKKIKGSKRYRLVFNESGNAYRKKTAKTPLRNYFSIAGIDNRLESNSLKLNGIWNLYFLPSDLKTFLFKLHHNTLGLNCRVHHFNELRDPSCFFCVKAGLLPAPRETFEHFFWHCPTTTTLLKNFWEYYLVGEPCQKKFFSGIVDTTDKTSVPAAVVFGVFKFCLWNFKLRKKMPTAPSINSDFLYVFNSILGSSKKFRESTQRCKILKNYRD
jgi:hypothetical protein